MGLDSAFTCTEDHAQVTSHVTNHTGLSLNEETVNTALTAFTQATGIPAVIVVEDIGDVFAERGASAFSASGSGISMFGAAVVLVVIVLIGWNLVRGRKNRDEGYDNY